MQLEETRSEFSHENKYRTRLHSKAQWVPMCNQSSGICQKAQLVTQRTFPPSDLIRSKFSSLPSGLRAQLHPHLNPKDLSPVLAKVIHVSSTIESLSVFLGGLLGMRTGDVVTMRGARMSATLKNIPAAFPKRQMGCIKQAE